MVGESYLGRAPRVLLVGFLLGMLGGDAKAAPSGLFVDCEQNPTGSVAVVVNPFREYAISLGDGSAASDGRLREWRDEVEVLALGGGEFAVITDGFGSRLHFDDVARGEGLLRYENSETGNSAVISLPDLGAPLTRALVQVTYNCG